MNTKNAILVSLIATAFLVAAVGSASAECPKCGATIDHSMVLTCNMTCPNTDGLIIGAPGITIDGYDAANDTYHWIDGVTADTGNVGIRNAGHDDVTIVNLTIKHFRDGLYISNANSNHIVGCTLHDNGAASHGPHESQGIRLASVCNSEVTGCTIYNTTGDTTMGCSSGGAGIHLFSHSNNNSITNNVIYNNALAGIYSKMRCSFNYVAYNTVYGNGRVAGGNNDNFGGGIRLQCRNTNGWTVEHNDVYDNIGPGILLRGANNAVNHNNVTGQRSSSTQTECSAYGPGTGIVSCKTGNTIENNKVCDNEYLDIDNLGGLSGDNNTCDTASNYCDGSAGCPPPCVFQCEEPGCVCDDGWCDNVGRAYYLCGERVTESCTLSGNMACPATGLYIGQSGTEAAPIVINGYNATQNEYFKISGPGGAVDSAGIYNDQAYDYITIVNLTVERFRNGIHIKGVSESNKAEHNRIVNCTVRDNGAATVVGHGIRLDSYVCDSEVVQSEVYNNTGNTGLGCSSGGAGIHLFKYCSNNSMTYNKIYNNTLAGVFSKMWPTNNIFSHNEVYGNGYVAGGGNDSFSGGIRLQCRNSNGWTIEYNDVHDNIGPGILLRGGNNAVNHNTVENQTNSSTQTECSAYGPGAGIISCKAGNTIEWNRICNNSYVDIDNLEGLSGDNNTCDTASDYCDGSAGCPPPCVYQCVPPEEPDLVIEDIKPVRWCCCCIEPEHIRTVKGGAESEKMQVMFIDDPELAKEFSDDELRKEVAEALAKDPELAEEVAAKLAGEDEKRAKELSRDPKQLAFYCCRCNAIRELADLLDTELTAEQQHEMSDQLDMIVGCGCCCCDCCLTAECCCCCCGRAIAYKIANVGDAEAGWSLSNLTVNGRVRSVDIVRPLDAGESRWEVFPCYRMWWPWHREVTVCADVTDWVTESDETNNCRTEWWPWIRPIPTSRPGPTLRPMPIPSPSLTR